MIEKLEAMLEAGQDSSNLRFALANAYFKQNDAPSAVEHALAATKLDPQYSAAWRLLGQARLAAGDIQDAADAFKRGIDVAQRKGDRQVEKEMRVFLKRIEKASGVSKP